jgi:hypothetical protein
MRHRNVGAPSKLSIIYFGGYAKSDNPNAWDSSPDSTSLT